MLRAQAWRMRFRSSGYIGVSVVSQRPGRSDPKVPVHQEFSEASWNHLEREMKADDGKPLPP